MLVASLVQSINRVHRWAIAEFGHNYFACWIGGWGTGHPTLLLYLRNAKGVTVPYDSFVAEFELDVRSLPKPLSS